MEFCAALISALPHFCYSEIVNMQMITIHLDPSKLNRNLPQDQFGRGNILMKLNKTPVSINKGI